MAKDKSNEINQLVRRGAMLLQRGRHDDAAEVLERALKRDPDNFDAALNLAAAYILAKKFPQAVELLEPLKDQEPDNAMVWTNLGAAYLGNPVLADEERQFKAVQCFINALEIDPATPNVAYNIGLIHRDRKEFPVAIQWFETALKTNPNDEDAQYWIDKIREKMAE